MTKKEKSLYQVKKAVAVCCDGLVGLQCLDVLYGIDDYMIVKGYTNDLHRVKINYTATGDSYIRLYNRRYRLSDFLRV